MKHLLKLSFKPFLRLNGCLVLIVFSTLTSGNLFGQTSENSLQETNHNLKFDELLISDILKANPKEFKEILNNPAAYEVQVIYTQINRDSVNRPTFKQYYYGAVNKDFYYPASLIKLPVSLLALQKIDSLSIRGVKSTSIMLTDSASMCQRRAVVDLTSENLKPSVSNYLKRMLLVSDNEAYNRIYEFLGQEYIHNSLAKKGFTSTRILSRFDANCNYAKNRITNPVAFYDSSGMLLYRQELAEYRTIYNPPFADVKKGKGYLDNNDKYVNGPKDFTNSNYISLADITEILIGIIYPHSVDSSKRFILTEENRIFLLKYLSMYPRESRSPMYNDVKYWDSFKKYFIYGGQNKTTIPFDTLRIFNVVGQSYGYLSDCAYIVDYKNKIEFILTAVIYVNKNGVINDNKYEYKEIGFPFLLNLSHAIYRYEKKRDRKFPPLLDDLRLIY